MVVLTGSSAAAAEAADAQQPGLTAAQRAFAATKRWVQLISVLRSAGHRLSANALRLPFCCRLIHVPSTS